MFNQLVLHTSNPGIGVMLPIVFGTFVGAMFTGFGHQPLLQQQGFTFILITIVGLGGMQLSPILIEAISISLAENGGATAQGIIPRTGYLVGEKRQGGLGSEVTKPDTLCDYWNL
mmetsp:Transcript_63392/g.206696  ORF Transcript_63392/g.206696 Transcript_63392/m.206696 type:complete len:115 (+) Transcript_63392:210-554(+)